jgi:hypothetical protein
MSTLRVDNLQASNGLSSAYSTVGVAKVAWAYEQVGTPSTIRGDNVSSITDGGTGLHTINATNNFDAADMAVACAASEAAATGNVDIYGIGDATAITSSAVPFVHEDTAGANADSDYAAGSMHGDLA